MDRDYSIVYSSMSGNTERLARALREVLPPGQCRYFGPPDRRAQRTRLLFAGFWTEKGTCDRASQDFLRSLHGKDLFLFGTAGFGGSPEYYEAILGEVRKLLDPSNRLAGSFLCQGKMPASVRARYEGLLRQSPHDAGMKAMLDNFDRAASHPDADDCEALQRLARQTLDSL